MSLPEIPPWDKSLGHRDMPTHRCNVCGGLWRLVHARDDKSPSGEGFWSMRSTCEPCCRDVHMGEQIVPLTTEHYMDILHFISHHVST